MNRTPPAVDLTTCDREPIHIPGTIQPHGVLLVMDSSTGVVQQVSENLLEFLGIAASTVLGNSIDAIVGPEHGTALRRDLDNASLERNPLYVRTIDAIVNGERRSFNVIAHRSQGVSILELEPAQSAAPISFHHLYSLLRDFMTKLEKVHTSDEVMQLSAAEVRRITGFDRVLIYRFNEDNSGTVIAEDRNDRLPSYLGLRFPASDIPKQARDLYRLNRLRLIADANYRPVPVIPALNPSTGRPLDMSFAALRSVSPVHLEYMRNMNTAASMSISIIRDDALWGLISCHHLTPQVVPFDIRTACDHMGQMLSLQIAEKANQEQYEERLRLANHQSCLLARMAEEDNFLAGLTQSPQLLQLTNARGAAVLFEDTCLLVGETPSEEQVRALAGWLEENMWPGEFHSDSLPEQFPPASEYIDRASGVLAVSISEVHHHSIFWFRPEVIRTVNWGGDPRKPATEEPGAVRLHPRRSFEVWKETVSGRAEPWSAEEIQAAKNFRNAVVNIVLRKAEELAALAADLERSNKELEAFSYSVSHDLRAPFRHIVGYSELLRESASDRLSPQESRYLATVMDSAHYAGTLVDNLLSFSQIGRTSLHPIKVDLNRLVQEVQAGVQADARGRKIQWRIAELPEVEADVILLRLALQNLLENAVKYTRTRDEAVIEIGSRVEAGEIIFFVRDNGVGFDMQYVNKLFGVFQRLHRMEDFEGTGIGLANVRRIISRHGGRTWAEGTPDEGATFYFTLPAREDAA